MKYSELNRNELMNEATFILNNKPIEERSYFCINSAVTQITTLRQMRIKIIENSQKQIKEIDIWINSITKILNKYLEDEKIK